MDKIMRMIREVYPILVFINPTMFERYILRPTNERGELKWKLKTFSLGILEVVNLSYKVFNIIKWEMLTSAFRTLVKNLVKESFDITFMGNEKNC